MEKNLSILLVILLSFNLIAQENTSITAYIEKPEKDGTKVRLKTPKEDIFLDFTKLDKETQDLISNSNPKKNQKITFPADALIEKKEVPFGIRADCSESSVDMDQLGEIALKSNDMVDFLKNIPEGSLQGFTFVTNSLSLHRGKKDENGEGQVSSMWPRVLRSSADGKLTVSFVCDPKNPTFGKVEIIHFDDKEKEFRTTEYDFGHPSGNKVSPKDRIHKDPVSCISCHAGSEFNGKVSLKPNWPEYFQWSDCQEDRGIQFYGGNDDNMGPGRFRGPFNPRNKCAYGETQASTRKEQDNFLKFREKQKDNDCFNSLPWPKDVPEVKDTNSKDFVKKWSYKYYPYAENSQEMNFDPKTQKMKQNYALRTNLRFTDTYSHLMSQRITHLLKKSPYFDTVKYLLVMEQAGCRITDEELKKANALMPGVNFSNFSNADHKLKAETPFLYNFSKIAGLSEKDWTMEFQEKDKPDYVSAMPNVRGSFNDLTINKVVGGEILRGIAQESPVIAEKSKGKITRGVAEVFGSEFSCIDDLGGGIINNSSIYGSYGSPTDDTFCASIRAENDANMEKIKEYQANCVECKKLALPKPAKKLAETIEETVKKLNLDQIARGKKLVEADSRGKCVMCHSASVDMLPKDFRFIPSEKDPKRNESLAVIQARKNEISAKLKNRLLKTKTMPPPPLGDELSDKDREDVNAYILSLAVGGK